MEARMQTMTISLENSRMIYIPHFRVLRYWRLWNEASQAVDWEGGRRRTSGGRRWVKTVKRLSARHSQPSSASRRRRRGTPAIAIGCILHSCQTSNYSHPAPRVKAAAHHRFTQALCKQHLSKTEASTSGLCVALSLYTT